MQNFDQTGNMMTVEAPAGGVSSGDVLLVDALLGVCATDAAVGEDVEIATQGVFTVPKLSTDVVTKGALLYWDDGNSRMTITAGALKVAGVAAEPAGNGVTTVQCRFNGTAHV